MSDLSEADIGRIVEAVAERMAKRPVEMPDPQSAIIKATVRATVQELSIHGMAVLGVNLADEKQAEGFKADLAFTRSFRVRCENVGTAVTKAVATALTWGILSLLAIGIIFWLRGQISSPPHPTSITK